MTVNEAKLNLLERSEDLVRHELARRVRQLEEEARTEAKRRARNLVAATALQAGFGLTAAEARVATLIGSGLGGPQAALVLGVSPDSVQVPSQYLPKSDTERQRMIKEADFAFKQAFAICPTSPEVVYRYVTFLMNQERKSDALLIAQSAAPQTR